MQQLLPRSNTGSINPTILHVFTHARICDECKNSAWKMMIGENQSQLVKMFQITLNKNEPPSHFLSWIAKDGREGGRIDAGAPPVGLNNSVAGLHYFHILFIQSHTPPRVHIEQPDSRCATAGRGQTANTVGLVIPSRGLRTGSSFFLGFWWRVWQKMFAHLSPHGCGLVTLLLQLCIVEARSQPDISWVSSHSPLLSLLLSFLPSACGFECTVGQKCFTQSLGANSVLLYFSVHSNWHHPLFQSPVKWRRWCSYYMGFILLVRIEMAWIQLAVVEIGHDEHFSHRWLA